MPNWCANVITLTHEDPVMIQRAREAFRERRLLQEFIPVPQALLDAKAQTSNTTLDNQTRKANLDEYGYENWYDYSVGEWGTKWDVGGEDEDYSEDSDHQVVLTFDSAWAPPIAAYHRLIEDHGFSVDAYYYEPGMAFAGIFRDSEDSCYGYSDLTADEIEENLPQELNEMFGISDDVRFWAEEAENLEIVLDPSQDEQ